MDKRRIRRLFRQDLRDAVLFLAGLAGVAHETLYVAQPREMLLVLFAAMMGLPAFLRADEALRNGRNNGDDRR